MKFILMDKSQITLLYLTFICSLLSVGYCNQISLAQSDPWDKNEKLLFSIREKLTGFDKELIFARNC